MRKVLAGRGALLIVALILLSACGGSGPSAQEWAGQVCDALTPWRARIAELNAGAQEQLSTATTPGQTRASLLELLAGGQQASETARSAVVAAGTPDVDAGSEVASRFAASLAQTRDAYAHAHADLAKLSVPDDSTFYAQVASVLDTLNAEYARAEVKTADIESVELRDAFDKVDRCQ